MKLFDKIRHLFNTGLTNQQLNQLSKIPLSQIKMLRKTPSYLQNIPLNEAEILGNLYDRYQVASFKQLNKSIDSQENALRKNIDITTQGLYNIRIVMRHPKSKKKGK